MKMSLDIASLNAAYAAGTLTPETVLAEIYTRIEVEGERPVWISLFSRKEALAKLKAAPKGPLWGIPFAVKDNIDVAGLPTTCACPEFAYTPERSASVVERLEAAGAIAIGKTNMDQFATGLVGTRTPYGTPTSVFDPDYISGGSSSGSAVAVAAGLVSFSLGTDTAGSGRVPAAFNNIVGLKPTKGLLSTRGVVPACRTQDAVSVFALTCADAARVLDVAAAFDPDDSYAREAPCRRAYEPIAQGLRIGVPSSELEFLGDNDTKRAYELATERLRTLGCEIVPFDFSPFRETAALLYSGPWVAERLAAIASFAESKPDAINDVVRGIIIGAGRIKGTDTFTGMYQLADLQRRARTEWAKMDAILLPTAPTTYTIAEVLADPILLNSNLGLYTNFVNLMDLSAVAIPAGFRTDGLPAGVTLMGPSFGEGRLLVLADALHRSLPDLKLGATATKLAQTAAVPTAPSTRIAVAVVGAHLTGQPLNTQLLERNARLLRSTRTAPGYSFFALANTTPPKPGLVFDGKGAGNIEVEIWEMDEASFGSFVALIPAPLGIGTIKLADGALVKGFLCEAHAVAGALDITSFGGWRAWRSAMASA
jgi:allophanate hydrolase